MKTPALILLEITALKEGFSLFGHDISITIRDRVDLKTDLESLYMLSYMSSIHANALSYVLKEASSLYGFLPCMVITF